jgi:hypothetical protein
MLDDGAAGASWGEAACAVEFLPGYKALSPASSFILGTSELLISTRLKT